jgi:hypothetical protein
MWELFTSGPGGDGEGEMRVRRSIVEADFMLSNDKLGNPKAVELSWLRAAFAEVDHLYGSIDAYARQGLGLDDATLDTPAGPPAGGQVDQ